jgi:hypothetical protein
MRKGPYFLPAALLSVCLFAAGPAQAATGRWEFNVHYSSWTLNLLRSLVEDKVGDALESDLKDRILESIQEDHPTFMERSYTQSVRFDSSGDNYGFELRFYPGGRNGSFSIGLAVERSSFKVAFPDVSADLVLEDTMTGQTAAFDGTANAEFVIKPMSFHLSFRWDIFSSARIHPYLTFGGGFSTVKSFLDARYVYAFSGILTNPDNSTEQHSDSDSKTLREIRDERLAEGEDDFPIKFLPILQLSLGLKARVTDSVHLLADFGVWDGFLFRGGLSIRL